MTMTAEEAKQKVNELKKEKQNDELKKIEKEIQTAIQERKNDVYIYAGLMPETIVSLKDLGYNVERKQTGPNEMALKVSW